MKGLEAVHNAGDFRSKVCIELLKEADIVCTNPPFSLFREYIAQLIEYNKKFIIIGNIAAIGCKYIFPLFKENKIWLGASIHSGDREFRVPRNYSVEFASNSREDSEQNLYVRIKGVRWFTNLSVKCRKRYLDTRAVYYTPEKYPKYDNYNAINVDKTADIPLDYPGIMGVPLTFMDKYNPEQFRIVGTSNNPKDLVGVDRIGEKWMNLYKKQGKKGHYTPNMRIPVYKKNGKATAPYERIFIKNLHPEQSRERIENK